MKFKTLTGFDDGHIIVVNLFRVQSIWARTENGREGTMLRMADGGSIFVSEPIKWFSTLLDW